MKTLGIILLTAIIFAVIVVGALFGVLGYINEETRRRCGNCLFWDCDLRICWGDTSKKGGVRQRLWQTHLEKNKVI